MKCIIPILILAIVLIAGCSQISTPVNSIVCTPNWVIGYGPISANIQDDICKSQCYAADKVTAHKIESSIKQDCECVDGSGSFIGLPTENTGNCNADCLKRFNPSGYPSVQISGSIRNTTFNTCYCDINNCNP
jgi:hypothetical protein